MHATAVDAEPENISRTISFSFDADCISDDNMSIGFFVG